MGKGIFITGTDTEVGKTFVTAGLLYSLRKNNIDAIPMKPVQSGAEECGGKLIASDLKFCLDACGYTPDDNECKKMNPYLYEPACSPHLAGRMCGNYPDIKTITDCARELTSAHDLVLVEGAGGIMVPVNESETMLDLMTTLNYPVILVAHTGLGTINHTLLSINALRSKGLDILGVIFNHVSAPADADKFIRQDNPDTIKQFGNVEVLGVIDHSPDPDWDNFEKQLCGFDKIMKKVS